MFNANDLARAREFDEDDLKKMTEQEKVKSYAYGQWGAKLQIRLTLRPQFEAKMDDQMKKMKAIVSRKLEKYTL